MLTESLQHTQTTLPLNAVIDCNLYLNKVFLAVTERRVLLQHCHIVMSKWSNRPRNIIVSTRQKLQQIRQLGLDGLLRHSGIRLISALH